MSSSFETTSWTWPAVAALLVASLVSVPLYRLFLHPLASIPGPPLAAVTKLYRFYFNVIKGGKYYLETERLHKVYGPIVRTAPNEVHLLDPSHYDKIYAPGRKGFPKDAGYYGVLNTKFAMFSTVENELHRHRRAPLEPFFSRRNVLATEGVVHDKVTKLCRLVGDTISRGQEFNLHAALRAVSVDTITEYAFDDCWGQLDRDDLGEWYSAMIRNSGITMWVLQQFPFLLTVVEAIPPRIARQLSPVMRDMLDCKDVCEPFHFISFHFISSRYLNVRGETDTRHWQQKTRRAVETIQQSIDSGYKPRQRTIFHELCDPQSQDPVSVSGRNRRRPTIDEMAEEAFSICAAASDTTGNAMEVAAYHVITNPAIYSKLRGELLERFPDDDDYDGSAVLSFAELEKLPYLTGVVKEGLRFVHLPFLPQARFVPTRFVSMRCN